MLYRKVLVNSNSDILIQHVAPVIKYKYLLYTKHISASTLHFCIISQNQCCVGYNSLKSNSLFTLFDAFLFASTNYCVLDKLLDTNW